MQPPSASENVKIIKYHPELKVQAYETNISGALYIHVIIQVAIISSLGCTEGVYQHTVVLLLCSPVLKIGNQS